MTAPLQALMSSCTQAEMTALMRDVVRLERTVQEQKEVIQSLIHLVRGGAVISEIEMLDTYGADT